MYNVRKCPKCGGNVPEGNTVCNNCGHKMSFFGGSTVIGSSSSRNANSVPSGNPFETNKSNNTGCIVAIIIFIFFGLPVVSIVYELYKVISEEMLEEENTYEDSLYLEDTCSNVCGSEYITYDNYCMCNDGNIYDEDGFNVYSSVGIEGFDLTQRCSIFCDDTFASYDGEKCMCSNGTYYDVEGNVLDVVQDENKLITNISDSIINGDTIVIYTTDIVKEHALDETELTNLASKYNLEFYYIDTDVVKLADRREFRSRYGLNTYINAHYYVFKNGVVVNQNEGELTLENMHNVFLAYQD